MAKERDAGAEHRLLQARARRHPQAAVVHEGAAPALGPIHVVRHWVVGDGPHDLAIALQGDVDREVRDCVQEVGRPVERVDDPGVGLVGALDHAPLFSEEAVAGPRPGQFLEDRLLGLQVRRRDEVRRPLLGDLQLGHFAEVPRQPPRRLARGVGHHLDQRRRRGH